MEAEGSDDQTQAYEESSVAGSGEVREEAGEPRKEEEEDTEGKC